jgi:hypothetical protein
MIIISIILLFTGIIGTLYYLPFTIYQLDKTIGSNILEFIYNLIPAFKEHITDTCLNILFGTTHPLTMLIISIVILAIGIISCLLIKRRRAT